MTQPTRPLARPDAPLPAGLPALLAAARRLHEAALPAKLDPRAGIGCMVIEGDLRRAPKDPCTAPDLVLRPLRENGWPAITSAAAAFSSTASR
jgi:hypothetical protein